MEIQEDLIQNVFFFVVGGGNFCGSISSLRHSDKRQPVLIFCYKTDQATERPSFDLPQTSSDSNKDKAPIIYPGSLGVFFFLTL